MLKHQVLPWLPWLQRLINIHGASTHSFKFDYNYWHNNTGNVLVRKTIQEFIFGVHNQVLDITVIFCLLFQIAWVWRGRERVHNFPGGPAPSHYRVLYQTSLDSRIKNTHIP